MTSDRLSTSNIHRLLEIRVRAKYGSLTTARLAQTVCGGSCRTHTRTTPRLLRGHGHGQRSHRTRTMAILLSSSRVTVLNTKTKKDTKINHKCGKGPETPFTDRLALIFTTLPTDIASTLKSKTRTFPE